MSKCIDHPRMVFKGTLYYEGHGVHFDIKDDVVEIRENSMTDYSVNVLGNEQILGMAIKQYSVGNGNYAASLTVPDMERKKLVVRVKTNNIYKVYIL